MGARVTAVVTYHRDSSPKTRVDFAALQAAVDFSRDRLHDPKVASVEVLIDDVPVWRAADLEQWREEVITETDTL